MLKEYSLDIQADTSSRCSLTKIDTAFSSLEIPSQLYMYKIMSRLFTRKTVI